MYVADVDASGEQRLADLLGELLLPGCRFSRAAAGLVMSAVSRSGRFHCHAKGMNTARLLRNGAVPKQGVPLFDPRCRNDVRFDAQSVP